MKIGILSDLHLYFDKYWDFEPEPDVFYICAGDITEDHVKRTEFINKHKDHMFTIMGNHDFYRGNFWIGPGHSIVVHNIRIAGATLWTEFKSPLDWMLYSRGLNDFSQINFMDEMGYNEAHKIQKEFLFSNKADIIVSHHAPFRKSIHEKYKGDLLNICFCSDLEEEFLQLEHKPKLWIHGHVHDSFDYMVGETRVICHPKGYFHETNYKNYKPLIVEI